MNEAALSQVFALFAVLIDYPGAALSSQARECRGLLSELYPEAVDKLEQFQQMVDQTTLEQLQERYTRTFELQPVCYPYVGYHLFGESYKRGAFMAKLSEGYRTYGFSAGNELPDHVGVVLRFLSASPAGGGSEFGRALVSEGLTPALEKMGAGLEAHSDQPYGYLIGSLLVVVASVAEGYARDEIAALRSQ